MTSRRSRQTRTLEAPPAPPQATRCTRSLCHFGIAPAPRADVLAASVRAPLRGARVLPPTVKILSSHRQIRRTPVRGSDRVARKRTGVHSTSWISDPCEGRLSQATGPRSGAQRTHFSRHECHFLVSYSETQ